MNNLPFLTVYDPPGYSEGSLDPLGLYLFADQLAMKLVPGVRERMLRVRFLTPMAVGALITEGLAANPHHPETPPFLVWEWLVVEAIIRAFMDDPDLWGLPGSLVVRRAITQYNYVDHRSYLKTPRVFGFHGVYKRLAVYLGLVDAHMRICEPNGLKLIEKWSKDQGIGSFDYTHPLFIRWRRVVESSLSKAPVRTYSHWTQHEWRTLAECFLPDGVKTNEKTYLKSLLLSESNGKLGALRNIWNLCHVYTEGMINEKELQRVLMEKEPRYAALLNAIRAYERFCRLMTDAFDSIRYMSSQTDTTGFQLSETQHDKTFSAVALEVHDAYHQAAQHIGIIYPDMEELFKIRFSRFAEPIPLSVFASIICEHHESIQQGKSREGKRPWFDRIGHGTIYMRPNYRRVDPPQISDTFVHDYRAKPIFRFYRDLK